MQATKASVWPQRSGPVYSQKGCHAAKDEMLLSLCTPCAQQFYNSPSHRIRRADHGQKTKDACDYCTSRYGFDYVVLSVE